MIGFGAIVKTIARVIEAKGSAAIQGLRLTFGQRPKLCPIVIPAEVKHRRR